MEAKTKTIETPYGDEELCAKCGGDVEWVDCYNCEKGYSHHDCGEDCCACLNPRPNVVCDVCGADGGWWRCYQCEAKQYIKNKPEINSKVEVKPNSSHE